MNPVWRDALLSVRTMFNGYYDFPSSMSFFKVTKSFSRVGERVTFIYYRCNFRGFKEAFEKNQILLVYIRYKKTRLLAPHP